MHSRKVRRIMGAGVIIVVIMGVVFLFLRGKQPEPVVEEPVKHESIFMDENTVTDPSQLEVEEEFKWLDVDLGTEDDMLVSRNTVLRTEPRDTADKVVDLAVDEWVKRDAYCTDMKGVELQWDRVEYKGQTGYVKSVDVDIMIANDGMEDDKVPPTASGVSEESIITVEKPVEEEPAEEVAEAEPTPEVQEEAPKAEEPALSTEPTPAPQAPTTNGISPENQAELEAKLAEMGMTLDEALAGAPVVHQEPGEGGHSGLVWQ